MVICKNRKRYQANACSVIGGADGPTSIFLARKGQKSLAPKDFLLNTCFRCQRSLLKKRIKPGTHSLEAVLKYITTKYHAHELPQNTRRYQEQYENMRFSMLCQQHEKTRSQMTSLQRRYRNIQTPEGGVNLELFEQLDAEINQLKKDALRLPEDVLPFDYHMYEIRSGHSLNIQVEIEFHSNSLYVSGNCEANRKKQMYGIIRDIYLYYGVSDKDIKGQTQRYQTLLTELSSTILSTH